MRWTCELASRDRTGAGPPHPRVAAAEERAVIRTCPRCQHPTLSISATDLAVLCRIPSVLLRSKRWCEHCGWRGHDAQGVVAFLGTGEPPGPRKVLPS
jgi:hypothetical protein